MEMTTIVADCVKSDRLGHVKGYLVRFGNPNQADMEGEFFTPNTDFGFPIRKGARVPLNVYYHHGMDSQIGKKSIGTGYVQVDDKGLWYEAQLDMADEYAAMVAKLCKEGKMGYSSGAAGHLVERKSVGTGAEITRWPIAEASITPTPAEYRNTVKTISDYYREMEMPEMEEGEMPMPPPPGDGMDPATFADEAYAGINLEVLHEGLETLFEALCAGIMALGATEGDRQAYASALISGFAERAQGMLSGIDINMKTVGAVQPDTLRATERRLRDVVGLSRSEAKRLAPQIWGSLRDADQIGVDFTPEVEQNTSTSGQREDLLTRINYLLEIV